MAIQYIEVNNLLYEVADNGQRELVRSTDSDHRAYLRFTNKTMRPVDVWWRDFRGTKHHYMTLEPRSYYEVNTFITHPWEFTDVSTNERYVVNNSPVFRAPPNLGNMLYRTNWNITISVRSLRHNALLVLAREINNPSQAAALELPKVLETDLQKLIVTYHQLDAQPNDY